MKITKWNVGILIICLVVSIALGLSVYNQYKINIVTEEPLINIKEMGYEEPIVTMVDNEGNIWELKETAP